MRDFKEYRNIKKLRCINKNSKYRGILHNDIIDGKIDMNFCFKQDSDHCFYPIDASYIELVKDGWILLGNAY